MNLFGIPIITHWSFWLLLALFGGADQAKSAEAWLDVGLFVLAGTVSIVVHELGHALSGRKFGAAAPVIQLYGMGGLTQFQHASFKRWQDFLVTFAGPLAGYALGLLAWAVLLRLPADGPPKIQLLFSQLVWINFLWSTFNLLPILPLDGGQMVRAALGPRRFRLALIISIITGVACLPFALQRQMLVGVLLLAYFIWENVKTLKTCPRR